MGDDPTAIKVVLVDDEELMREGLAQLLSDTTEVVAQANNGKEAVSAVLDSRPDVVLMDIRMPVMDGIAATRMILSSLNIPIIMLTAFDTDEFIVTAMQAGAVGFLLKTTPKASLISAIRAAAVGQPILSPEVLERLVAQHPIRRTNNRLSSLSTREMEIAKLVSKGLSNQAISDELFISLTTVKSHVKSILSKINGTNRVHIALAVFESK